MKKMIMVLMMVFTMMAGLFAEEKTWNVEYHIRTVTPDEFYLTVKKNPHWQEYDWWIDEDHDDFVDYVDPYWDNDELITAMKKILQEVESLKKEHKNDKKYVFLEISYGDSFDDKLNTTRVFIRDLETYEMWEFCFLEAALSEKKQEAVVSSDTQQFTKEYPYYWLISEDKSHIIVYQGLSDGRMVVLLHEETN